jgi:hypothetical protein
LLLLLVRLLAVGTTGWLGGESLLSLLQFFLLLHFRWRRPAAVAVRALGTTPLRRTATAATTDFRHVTTIDADFFASFPTGRSGLVGGKLVGLAFFMGRPPAFARDFALAMGVHGGEASVPGSWCCFHFDTDSLHRSDEKISRHPPLRRDVTPDEMHSSANPSRSA